MLLFELVVLQYMAFEVELELRINEEDGSIVVQKMSELVNKARDLGLL
jgi:hypothetical protein